VETPELTSSEYWESDTIDLRLNPRRAVVAAGLVEFLHERCGLSSSVVLATSGSTGDFKFVVLSKKALLVSAKAVVEHCGMTGADVSLAGLSGFHVGGLGIFARAWLTGGIVIDASHRKWDRRGQWFADLIREHRVTQTSMTPTHLHDLVSHQVAAPDSLRCVLLGGGSMNPHLIAAGRDLGWPVRVSYGMTEAGSQIATATGTEIDWLPVLPCWNARVGEDGRLAISGEALFSGYAFQEAGNWRYETATGGENWFTTGDRCELREGKLRFIGRADDLVKISGELVSLGRVEAHATALAQERGAEAAVLAVPHSRRENELVVVIEESAGDRGEFLKSLNRRLDRIEAIHRVEVVPEIPRTGIGKLDRAALRRIINRVG
jgi:O-succinylbenzoic acid--CoA ligase